MIRFPWLGSVLFTLTSIVAGCSASDSASTASPTSGGLTSGGIGNTDAPGNGGSSETGGMANAGGASSSGASPATGGTLTINGRLEVPMLTIDVVGGGAITSK